MKTPPKLPSFSNFAEYEKYMRGKEQPKQTKPKKATSRGKRISTLPTKSKPENVAQTGEVYKEIHYYLREGDTWPNILKDARDEAKGPGTFVYAHNHQPSNPCSEACKWFE